MASMKDKERRLKDFADRVTADPSSLVRLNNLELEYIPIHPMSNETQVLERLGLRPSDCLEVDCYCHYPDDVVFLQMYSKLSGPLRDFGLYARWSGGEMPMVYLAAHIEADFISQYLAETVMEHVSQIGLDYIIKKIGDGKQDQYVFIDSA